MKLRSKQLSGECKNPKARNKIIANQICQIPIQHIKGSLFRRVIYVPEQNIIIAQGYFRQFILAKIFDNKIELCNDADEIIQDYQLLVNHKKQLLLIINRNKMIKLQLSNLNIFEEVRLKFCFYKNYQYIVQDERNVNNFLIFDHMHLQFRRMQDLKLKFQMVWDQIPTNLKLNRHCFSYQARDYYYIHSNLKGKIIRKMEGPFINPVKNFDSILVMPYLSLDNEHYQDIININSMKFICQLYTKKGQYKDSILIEEQKILIILNSKNIMAYDTNNYKLLDEIQLPNHGAPYKLNYHKSIGIQIFYEIQNWKFKQKMINKIFLC